MKPNEASDKFRSYMRLKHLALSTEQSYLAWLARYMRFLSAADVEGMTAEQKVEAFAVRWRSFSPSLQRTTAALTIHLRRLIADDQHRDQC
jgi:hypothetical protein